MPLKAIPFFNLGTDRAALNRIQRRYLVSGMREIMVEVWPKDLQLLLHLRIPILDVLTRQQLIEVAAHMRKYRSLIRRLKPEELERVMAEARPDLFDLISLNGGRGWLRNQLADLKELAAQK